MQVEANSYAQLSSKYQKPSILPIALPDYTDKEIYEGSGGNIVRGDDGKLHFTPQAKTKQSRTSIRRVRTKPTRKTGALLMTQPHHLKTLP